VASGRFPRIARSEVSRNGTCDRMPSLMWSVEGANNFSHISLVKSEFGGTRDLAQQRYLVSMCFPMLTCVNIILEACKSRLSESELEFNSHREHASDSRQTGMPALRSDYIDSIRIAAQIRRSLSVIAQLTGPREQG
jgi:hypothetical protein